LYPPPRPLTVGEILDLSFRIYRRTCVKCLLFGALMVVSSRLPSIYSAVRGRPLVQAILQPNLILTLVGAVLASLIYVAMTSREYRLIAGQPAGGELLQVLRWFGRVLLVVILLLVLGVVCGLLLIPAFLATGLMRYVLIGLLLLPMGYLFLRLGSTFTAMVVEETDATGSLGRSWELTGGNVLRLTAIYTVVLFLLFAMYVVVASLAGFLYLALGRGDLVMTAAVVGVITVAVGAVVAPYYSSIALAIYGDLRARKEGADLSQRISAT
jgi:Membrane domain of glycerophosphoryl diester phosphodiesterase